MKPAGDSSGKKENAGGSSGTTKDRRRTTMQTGDASSDKNLMQAEKSSINIVDQSNNASVTDFDKMLSETKLKGSENKIESVIEKTEG